MSALPDARKDSRPSLKIAVIAAIVGVAGCFLAAFIFAGESVEASEAPAANETTPR